MNPAVFWHPGSEHDVEVTFKDSGGTEYKIAQYFFVAGLVQLRWR